MNFFLDDPVNPQHFALFNAAARGDLERVKLLLSDDNVNATTLVNGFNALHISTKKGHSFIVKALIEKYPQLALSRTGDVQSRTACMLAAFEGRLDVVTTLWECMATSLGFVTINDELIDKAGNSSLHYAAWGGSLGVVQYLVERAGADISLRNGEGLSSYEMAAAGNHVDVMKYLADCGPEPAQRTRSAGIAELGVAVRGESGYGALHRAALHGSLEATRSILTSSSSYHTSDSAAHIVNDRSRNGSTALHLACHNGHIDIAMLLLHHGANINAKNDASMSSLHLACVGGHTNVVHFLLGYTYPHGQKQRVDVKALNMCGASAFHLAAANGKHEICELLAKMDELDIFARDEEGLTAIDAALGSGYKALASKIAKWGFIHMRARRLKAGYMQQHERHARSAGSIG